MNVMSLLLLAVSFMQIRLQCDDCPVVRVQQGLLRGTSLTSIHNRVKFKGFLGIPYAKPPVGELRFKDPLPPDSWNGIRDAATEANWCPQNEDLVWILWGINLNTTMGIEDCLFLNIYTPELPLEGKPLKETMVFIHGGGFAYGSGSRFFYNPDFFMDQDVVIVTLNYRLGALGFLSTEDDVISGNAGLKDQVMALQWLQSNIAQFGGNPNKVTLFGFSAGAASVQYHMVSPMSKGLFHGGIAQSGSFLNIWAFNSSPRLSAFRLGAQLGLQTNSSKELSIFLRNVSTKDILLATESLLTYEEKPVGFGYPFHPCVDNHSKGEVFLPANPKELLDSKRFHRLPFVTGVNSQEGTFFLFYIRSFWASFPNGLEAINHDLKRLVPQDLLKSQNTSTAQEFALKVKKFYFTDKDISRGTLLKLADLLTDVWFLKDIMSAARKFAVTNPVYFYHFGFDGTWKFLKPLLGNNSIPGVPHSEELAYIMPLFVSLLSMNPDDEAASITSRRVVKMWTNFAKTGNPTPEVDPLLNVTWTPFTNENLAYLNIDKNLEMRHNLHSKRLQFWESIYKAAHKFQRNE